MKKEVEFLTVPMYLLQSDDTTGAGVREDDIMEKLKFGMAGRGDGVTESRGVPGGEGKSRGRGGEPGSHKAITHSTEYRPQKPAS